MNGRTPIWKVFSQKEMYDNVWDRDWWGPVTFFPGSFSIGNFSGDGDDFHTYDEAERAAQNLPPGVPYKIININSTSSLTF